MFDHPEYHIYTTNDRLEKRHVHLTEAKLTEARDLHEQEYPVAKDWQTIHRLEVADNIYLTVGDGAYRAPRLETRGYEGWVGADDGKFEEPVFFGSMIFYKCIGEYSDPEWSFAEVKEWVNYEHRPQFEDEFDEYLTEHHDPDDVAVDW